MSARTQDLSPETLAARLARNRPAEISRVLAPRRSAVAAVLRFAGDGSPEVLLMQRTVRKDDRWSGQVSLPGGGQEDGDLDLVATAVRETREEVGIDLRESARLVGRLDAVQAIAKGRLLPMSIQPFVFFQTRPDEATPGEEAESLFWLPLARASRGELDGEHTHYLGPLPLKFDCWRFEERVVWGLTYGILRDLLRVAAAGH